MDKDWDDVPELNERDVDVLEVIDEENLTYFTFEGLKRRLNIHQETLSRILSRLTEEEILKKNSSDYALTSKAKELLKSHSPDTSITPLPFVQTFLPPHFSLNKLICSLKGKWFGALRWLGYSTLDENVTLKWITDDGGTVISAIFSQGMLRIEAKLVSENDVNDALNASYQLMGQITKFISKTEHN